MADLSKIKINGTAYEIKDAVARDSIPTAFSDLENDTDFVMASVAGTTLYFTRTLENGDEVNY